VGAIALVVVLLLVIMLIRRRNKDRAMKGWRHETTYVLDEAQLAQSLLPRPGDDVADSAHWHSVRERVDQVAQSLDRASASAPTMEGSSATRAAADALRGVVFALEADHLLRDGTRAPTPDQLAEADATARARRADLAAALEQLERLVKPMGAGQPQPTAVDR
jgi:hypothetical protein